MRKKNAMRNNITDFSQCSSQIYAAQNKQNKSKSHSACLSLSFSIWGESISRFSNLTSLTTKVIRSIIFSRDGLPALPEKNKINQHGTSWKAGSPKTDLFTASISPKSIIIIMILAHTNNFHHYFAISSNTRTQTPRKSTSCGVNSNQTANQDRSSLENDRQVKVDAENQERVFRSSS